MLALICFIVATVFAVVAASGGHLITDNPMAWAIVFIAAGLAFTTIPNWPAWPRRGP